jgi:16S rRNA (guanine527-N7)-methyltransferase
VKHLPGQVAGAEARAAVDDALREADITLDAHAREAVARLLEVLAATPVNVTTVRELEAAARRHVVDALRGLPALDGAPPGPVADVGSGGGLPGLVLAAARPAREVHLIESVGRKAGVIHDAADAMGVAVTVHAARSEELASSPVWRERFACVCARALATPPAAVELCAPLCRVGGRVVLWVGERADRDPLTRAAEIVGAGVEEWPDPGLAVLAKRARTPPRFPRRPGVAARKPLA